jgi:hypothetical protein
MTTWRLTWRDGAAFKVELISCVPLAKKPSLSALLLEIKECWKNPYLWTEGQKYPQSHLIDRLLSLIPLVGTDAHLSCEDFAEDSETLCALVHEGSNGEKSIIEQMHKEDSKLYPFDPSDTPYVPPVCASAALYASLCKLIGAESATHILQTHTDSETRAFIQEYLNVLNPEPRKLKYAELALLKWSEEESEKVEHRRAAFFERNLPKGINLEALRGDR